MFVRSSLKVLLSIGLAMFVAGCGTSMVDSIQVTPATVNFGGVGLQAQLTATGSYGHGPQHPATQQDVTNLVTWSTSSADVATVSSSGLVTSVGPGVIQITASMNGFTGVVSSSSTITVTVSSGGGGGGTGAEPVTALTILPNVQAVATPGEAAQFLAIGTSGTTGLQVNETSKVTWTSSSTAVATICTIGSPAPCTNSTTGLATGLSQGSTTITAIYTNPDQTIVTATAAFTVTSATGSAPEPLQSIAITPAAQAILTGQTSQLIAIGTFTSSSTNPGPGNHDITSSVIWNTSNQGVAGITPAGLVTANGAGTAVVTAIYANPDKTVVTAAATVTVTGPTTGASEPLVSLAIVPGTASVAGAGQTSQFLAMGTFSASSTTPGTQNMASIPTYTVTWYSSNPGVATISNTAPNAGVVTATGQGTTAITAIATNIADKSSSYATAAFTVTGQPAQQVSALAIIPSTQTVTMPLVTPTLPTTFFAAIGTNGNTGLQVDETDSASWTSSNTAVATINPATGAVTPVGQGTTTITALYNNPSTSTTPASVVTATANLTVNGVAAEPLLSLAIMPGSQTIAYPGQTSQLIAIGTFSAAPTTQNLTASATYPVKWTSSNVAVATVCSPDVPATCTTNPAKPGLVTATGQGTAAITAIAANTDQSVVTGVSTITVTNGAMEQITSLSIIPGSLSLSATGQPGQFVALGVSGTTGLVEDVTNSPQLTWTSNIPTYATVGSYGTIPATIPGQAQGVSAGTTNIVAEYTNTPATANSPAVVVSASASVAVSNTPAAEPLLSIAVLPATITDLNLLGTGQFLAYGTFSTAPTVLEITNGFSHPGFPASCTANCPTVPVTWVSTDPYNFPVNSQGADGAVGGLSTAYGTGSADIYAIAANPDSTLVYSPMATFNCPYAPPTYGTITVTQNGIATTTTDYNDLLNPGTCNTLTIGQSLLSTLTVFNTGLNTANWLITGPSATGTPDVIHCGGSTEQAAAGGSVCEATYPNGTIVTLTAPPEPSVNFGGWSNNCVAQGAVTVNGPNTCQVVVGGGCTLNVNTETYTCTNASNVSVGAIFN